MLIVRLRRGHRCCDSVRPSITLRMIQDNIKLAQNHDAVVVVEAVDTIVGALMVNSLQIFQIVLSIKDKHLKHSVAGLRTFTVLC